MIDNILSIFKTFPLLVAMPAIILCIFFFMPKHRLTIIASFLLMVYLPVVFAPRLIQYCGGECAVPIGLLLVFIQVLVAVFTALAYFLLTAYGEM